MVWHIVAPLSTFALAASGGSSSARLQTQITNAMDLNADLSKRVLMRTSEMEWTRSGPTANVERKRCFRSGGQESGSVTSVVRYLPGASFPLHPHPQGEEIFVLEGVFSDKRGDHGPGVFLLNPEGFEHAPSSDPGNLILVRLRQYPNADPPSPGRTQAAIDTESLPWVPVPDRGMGVSNKLLYPLDESQRSSYPERQWLERWMADAHPTPTMVGENGVEIFVVEGGFSDAEGQYRKGDWLRLPRGTIFDGTPGTDGCILLCKSGGLKYVIPETS